MNDLKAFLDAKVAQYNRPEFIAADPIAIPHRFSRRQDIEITGFWAATLAWGQRKTIINKASELIARMDGAPYDFVRNHTPTDLKRFLSFRHRTFNATDALYFLAFFQHYYARHDSLEDAFLPDSQDGQAFARVSEVGGTIPIIVLSNSKNEEAALQAIREGAQDYLTKGEIDSKLLKKAIWYAIERNNLFRDRLLVAQELKSHERLLQLITRISTTFINLSSEQIDESIELALKMVGSFLEADRAFVIQINDGLPPERTPGPAQRTGRERPTPHLSDGVAGRLRDNAASPETPTQPRLAVPQSVPQSAQRFRNRPEVLISAGRPENSDGFRYEWMAPDADPGASDSSGGILLDVGTLRLADYGWIMDDLRESGVFVLNRPEELPPPETAFRDGLRVCGIESLLLVGIYYEKKLAALFGLASRQPAKLWNGETVSLLNASGEVFYRAIKKKQAEEALKESERNHRTLVESINEGLVYVDAAGYVVFVNDRVCQMLGYTSEELVGKEAANPHLFDKNYRNLIRRKRGQRTGTPAVNQYELPIRTSNQETRWMLVNGHTVFNDRNETVGSLVTLVDITDRKRAEEKLQRVNQELKTFIYRASHDLRGPLASVLGLTNLAQMQVNDGEALKFFDYIRVSVSKLDRTLKALTDVANITQAVEDFTEIDFQRLIEEAVKTALDNNGINPPTLVKTDLKVLQPVRFLSGLQPLRYVLENLIDNSVKYGYPGRPLQLTVRVAVTDQSASIEVADNGMGIAPALHGRVFDMFFRGNERSRGSGLGLYVVEKLLSSLNGNVRLESEEGVGSRFFIHLKNMA